MISDSIICGNSTGRERGSDVTAVRSILSVLGMTVNVVCVGVLVVMVSLLGKC